MYNWHLNTSRLISDKFFKKYSSNKLDAIEWLESILNQKTNKIRNMTLDLIRSKHPEISID